MACELHTFKLDGHPVTVCKTHDWEFIGAPALTCPIGRIEAAADLAIDRVRMIARANAAMMLKTSVRAGDVGGGG